MIIKTKYLGEVEVMADKIIQFTAGLPGFQDEKRFVLLDMPGNEWLQILQSVQTTELAFIVTNPHHFYPDYTITLDESILYALQIQNEHEVIILSILTIHEPFSSSTINLKAPIIIHAEKRIGKQFISANDSYAIKTAISIPFLEEGGK